MEGFKPGDIVKVPFPYTDRATRQSRPALVVADLAEHSLLWVVMITSAQNRPWPDDVTVTDLETAGLPAPSVVRPAKIATLDVGDAQRIGVAPQALLATVLKQIKDRLITAP